MPVDTFSVIGTFANADNSPAIGTIAFFANNDWDINTGVIVDGAPVIVTLNDLGSVPHTDLLCNVGGYHVLVKIGPPGNTVEFDIASQTPFSVLDLSTIDAETSTFQSSDIGRAAVPIGGTTGQVLTKISGADYDDGWADAGGGGGAVNSVNGHTGTVVLTAADVSADASGAAATAQAAAIAASQPLDGDLTTIAGLTATTDGILQSKSSAWSVRTPAQVKTDLALTKSDVGLSNVDNTADASKTFTESQITSLVTDLGNKQPLDSDLTTIAGLTATTDSIIQSKSSAWSVRTPAQFKTDLVLVKADVGLGSVDNTADASKAFAGSQITSGTVNIARIPTGTTSSTVPLGGVITAAGPQGDASHTQVLTWNAAGQVTAVTNTAIAIAESAVTGLVTDLGNKAQALARTAVKTATTYTAAASELVPADTSSNSITVTLPTAPADRTVVGVRQIIRGGSNTVTISTAGSDVFSRAGGPTTATLTLAGQELICQYDSATSIWTPISDGYPLAQLDLRYFGITGTVGGDLTGALPNPTIAAGAVSLSKMANLAANSILGNNTGSSATPIALTVAQIKTLLAYVAADIPTLAPLTSPSFLGTVNAAAQIIAAGAITMTGGTCLGGSFESRTGTFGLTFIATEYNHVCATYDARSTRGTGNGNFSHSLSGDALFCLRGGGSTDSAFADCGKIQWTATQDFSGTAAGSSCGIYTVPNNTLGLVLGLLVDQDGSATVTNNLTIGGALTLPVVGIGATGLVTGVTGYTQGSFALSTAMFLRRANGSSGSETQILSTQGLGSINFQGWNNTNAGYLASAAISATAEQDFTTTGFRGTRLNFNTAPSSVNGGPLTRLIIDNAGKIWIGSTTAATTSIDQSGNGILAGTLTVAGNIGFNGKTAQATTGWSAPTATLDRTAVVNPAYTTTGGTGTTAGAFDTNTHRDNIITGLFLVTKQLAALITDLRANGVIA